MCALESGNYINDLNILNPAGSDAKSKGDDHIRLVKEALKTSLNGFTGSILITGTEGGAADAYTLTPTPALPGYTTGLMVLLIPTNDNTTTSTLNISALGTKTIKHTDGSAVVAGDLVTGDITVLCYDGTDFIIIGGEGMLSNVGDQTLTGDLTLTGSQTVSGTLAVTGVLSGTTIEGKAPVADPTFTGTVTVPQISTGSANSADAADVAFVNNAINNAVVNDVMPGQTGNDNKYLQTDGANATWQFVQNHFNFENFI